MPIKTPTYLDSLRTKSEFVRKQFACEDQAQPDEDGVPDPLEEERFEPVPKLVHKYENRVLCILTTACAAYCSFCTRRRIVGEGRAEESTKAQIDNWIEYIRRHPRITEAILSGGDPFAASDEIFLYAFNSISGLDQIKVMRIGTRAVVSEPALIREPKLSVINSHSKPVYVGINFEHPDEITPECERAVRELRKAGAILYSQTVFLKGVNDDYETLRNLFTRLLECGVRPYYIYRCDPVRGLSRFRVDFRKEREIMTKLRKELSGLACPTYVIDTPHGSGKIPVPLDFWDFCDTRFVDFDGTPHKPV